MSATPSVRRPYRLTRHPTLLCGLAVWIGWLLLISVTGNWPLFLTEWPMSVTMAFGSFIAGATSEGGGAVAFPVMTLGFGIAPSVARDFSLLIQAVGMMAAAFTIYCLRIPVVRQAIVWSSLGGVLGVILGLDVVSPLLPPAYAKLFFVSLWFSFAGALFWMNKDRNRPIFDTIQDFDARHALLLFGTGFLGGMVSGLVGSGLDILTFALLVLAFRIDEKIATPTSVVLMGINALMGVLWREMFTTGMAQEAWNYWYVCVPIVVIGAPAGARFIYRRSRHFIVGFLYFSIVVQYLAALIILPLSTVLLVFSGGVLILGLLGFHYMAHLGHRRLATLVQVETRHAD